LYSVWIWASCPASSASSSCLPSSSSFYFLLLWNAIYRKLFICETNLGRRIILK
jgi:hypothetical protein